MDQDIEVHARRVERRDDPRSNPRNPAEEAPGGTTDKCCGERAHDALQNQHGHDMASRDRVYECQKVGVERSLIVDDALFPEPTSGQEFLGPLVVTLTVPEQLAEEGIAANQLHIKWIVPFHAEAITEILQQCKKVIIVEINYSGQFARYLRAETGFTADGFIRKYDGEPFMPHHIVEAVKDQLAGKETLSVPEHEISV